MQTHSLFRFGLSTALMMVMAQTSLAQRVQPVNVTAVQADIGSSFTYQGQLRKSNSMVNAQCNFRFSLYDALSGGSQADGTSIQTHTNITVTRGLFTITNLDFGDEAFLGDPRWLHVEVQCPGDGGYIALSPRTPVNPAPNALYARYAGAIYERRVTVWGLGDTPIQHGVALSHALAIIGAEASAVKPFVLYVPPGVYDMQTGSLWLKPYVTVEGAGELRTTITAVGDNCSSDINSVGTVRGVPNSELRKLTVINTGGSKCATAIFNEGQSGDEGVIRMSQVTAIASGSHQGGIGVLNKRANTEMTDVTVDATGSSEAIGVFNFLCSSYGHSATLLRVVASAHDANKNTGFYSNQCTTTIRQGTTMAWGGSEKYGVGGDSYGDPFVVALDQVTIRGDTATVMIGSNGITPTRSITVMVNASQLIGGPVIFGNGTYTATMKCRANTDEGNVFYPAVCP
jgi:hypothetical protein